MWSEDYDKHKDGKHQQWYDMGNERFLNITADGNDVIGIAWYDEENNHIRTAYPCPQETRDKAPVIYDERD
jgi:hypothetical protein